MKRVLNYVVIQKGEREFGLITKPEYLQSPDDYKAVYTFKFHDKAVAAIEQMKKLGVDGYKEYMMRGGFKN